MYRYVLYVTILIALVNGIVCGAALAPCTFAESSGSNTSTASLQQHTIRVRERYCLLPEQPFVLAPKPGGGPQYDDRITIMGTPEPPHDSETWGTTVWGGGGGGGGASSNRSLMADVKGASLMVDGIRCADCLDLAAATPRELLLPPTIMAPPRGAALPAEVGLRNTRIIGHGAAVMREAPALFARILRFAALQWLLAEWSLAVYTDGASYLLIPDARFASLTLECAGAFALPAPPPMRAPMPRMPPPPGVNFLLQVPQGLVHRVLIECGGVDTDVPFLIVLKENVTLAPHPNLPPGGIVIRRPMTITGLRGVLTAVDFGMRVNFIRLTGRGNLTFDSLALDNLAAGDGETARTLRGVSITVSYNVYAVNWNREDRRLSIVRCTLGVPTQIEIERSRFFLSNFKSADPQLRKQAEWMGRGPRATQARLAIDSSRPGLSIELFYYKAIVFKDVYIFNGTMVFPRLPQPPNELVAAERAAEALGSPLAAPPVTTYLRAPGDLLAGLPLVRPTTIFVVPSEGADLTPNATAGWPPPGGAVITAPPVAYTLLFIGDPPDAQASPGMAAAAAAAGEPSGPDNQTKEEAVAAQRLGGGGRRGEPAEWRWHVPPLRAPGAPRRRALRLGFGAGLLVVPPGSDETIELRGLTLLGLAQGRRRAGGSAGVLPTVGEPRVWAHLLWAIESPLNDTRLSLTDCELALPAPELARLLALAAARGPDFDVPVDVGGALSFRGARVVVGDVTPAAAAADDGGGGGSGGIDGRALAIETYNGAGLKGARLLFVREQEPLPEGYYWPPAPPVDEGPNRAGGGSGAPQPPVWAVALAVGGSVVVVLAGAVVVAKHARRRRQQRRQQLERQHQRRGGRGGDNRGGVTIDISAVAEGTGVKRDSDDDSDDAAAARDTAPGRGGHPNARRDSNGSGGSGSTSSDASDPHQRWRRMSQQIGTRIGAIRAAQMGAALAADAAEASLRTGTAAFAGGGGGGSGAAGTAGGSAGGAAAGEAAALASAAASLDLRLLEPVGQGSFGTVWRALLQNKTVVAVKLMQLPDLSSLGPAGADAAATIRERMVVQEATIASSMSHPHVVPVFSVALRPCAHPPAHPMANAAELTPENVPHLLAQQPGASARGGGAGAGGAPAAAASTAAPPATTPLLWQLTIVMEFADQGTLRRALDLGRLRPARGGRAHLLAALSLARDVAAAMEYLHRQSVTHGDLKASNVLLKTAYPPNARAGGHGSGGSLGGSGGGGGGGSPNPITGGAVVAKIADFGLSSFLDTAGASVAGTAITGGTLTHMAPELLTGARPSKAADVYSYGILLFELFTGERPYAGFPHALLGHAVVACKRRPLWPALPPECAPIKQLATECWAAAPQARPSFGDIVARLEALHAAWCGGHATGSGGSGEGGAIGGAEGAAALALRPAWSPPLALGTPAEAGNGSGSVAGGSGGGSSTPRAGANALLGAAGTPNARRNSSSSIVGWL